MFYRTIDEHLSLRLPMRRDAAALLALVERNRAEFERWFLWATKTKTVDDELAFVDQAAKDWADRTSVTALIWLDGEIVGSCGLHFFNWDAKRCEIGYWLDEAHWGQGIATRVAQELQKMAFDELDIQRVSIHADATNARSRAVAERLGYTLEGVLRRHLPYGDHAGDEAVYSLLKEEWEAAR